MHAPTYLYRYDYAPRTLRWSGFGATHATELFAVFDIYRTRFGALLTAAADRRHALRVSDEVIRRWRSFSQTGTPGEDCRLHAHPPCCHGDRPQESRRDRSAPAPQAGVGRLLAGAVNVMNDEGDQNAGIIEEPGDLTASWLTEKIGAGDVTEFTVERIGTGQMSECYSVQLTYAVPAVRRRWCSRSRPPIR
ncbi:carboxylesterase family protein [Mycobacterium ulcerans str. Harvey]|uniref:Carboxylesterase family protein n=1 Tax=Mycobacterium ulcerans str. Harvey TaxID=1299332 RepID=A0ABN0QYK3_MYCUL|nr:carboxylesterase family protein [Mycobacterium ulcerans str. Harvey]